MSFTKLYISFALAFGSFTLENFSLQNNWFLLPLHKIELFQNYILLPDLIRKRFNLKYFPDARNIIENNS